MARGNGGGEGKGRGSLDREEGMEVVCLYVCFNGMVTERFTFRQILFFYFSFL